MAREEGARSLVPRIRGKAAMFVLLIVAVVALTVVAPASAIHSQAAALKACRAAAEDHSEIVSRAGDQVAEWNEQMIDISSDADTQLLRDFRIGLADLNESLKELFPECSPTDRTETLDQLTADLAAHSDQVSQMLDSAASSGTVVTATSDRERVERAREGLDAALSDSVALTTGTAASAELGRVMDQAWDLLYDTPPILDLIKGNSLVESYNDMTRRLIDANFRERISRIIGDTRVGIEVVDLFNDQTIFARDANQLFTTASTYKVFVAYSMAREVESGRLTWDSYFDGQSLEGCRDVMILYSDNDCAEEWLMLYGLKPVQEELSDLGAVDTSLEDYDLQTTPADMALVLSLLYHHELLNDRDTDELLSLMKEQTFREGIPYYLEPEAVVANKVGWLDDVVNDAGIVYSPYGDYVFSIYTEQSEWSMVTDLSRVIYQWIEQRHTLAVSSD